MSEFDISFELFTLLLGFAMAEVLAGFVRLQAAQPLPPRARRRAAGRYSAASRSRFAFFAAAGADPARSSIGLRYCPV